jgi:hypothetical protein
MAGMGWSVFFELLRAKIAEDEAFFPYLASHKSGKYCPEVISWQGLNQLESLMCNQTFNGLEANCTLEQVAALQEINSFVCSVCRGEALWEITIAEQ